MIPSGTEGRGGGGGEGRVVVGRGGLLGEGMGGGGVPVSALSRQTLRHWATYTVLS